MHSVLLSVPALAVSTIYCIWHTYALWLRLQRAQVLRERVAYMLWVMANETN